MIGVLSDRYNPVKACLMMICTNIISLIVIIVGGMNQLIISLYVGSLIFGSIYSVGAVGIPLLTKYFFGLENYSQAYSKIGFLTNVGSSSSLTVIGYVYDFTGTYLYVFIVAIMIHIFNMILMMIILKKSKKEYSI